MADDPVKNQAEGGGDESAATALDSGNYEVIRQRLVAHGRELRARTEALNAKRKAVFGGAELSVVANERIRTENNCVPRDIVTVKGLLLFAYNVFIGLKKETSVSDVFALHRFEPSEDGFDCSAVPLDSAGGFLVDPEFEKGFQNLYKYYRDAAMLRLVKTDTSLLAVFQAGSSSDELKVFRWRIEGNGDVTFVDDRGARDYVYPTQHDFEWTELGRDDQVGGTHPHINVLDTLFINNTAGGFTVKIENNTQSGAGIFEDPLEDVNQTLDDASFRYAQLGGLILLELLPYRETARRYYVYDTRSERVTRIDSLGQSCVQLPEDHGILFPGGFYLQQGAFKVFDHDAAGLQLERAIKSPNGEDVLYVYYRRSDGHYALFPYNMIRKEVQTPIHCHGFSLFDDGRLVVFRALNEEPTRVHPMQVWQTPFTSAAYAAEAPTDGSYLANVGNAELVRGISDAFSVTSLIANDNPNRQTFEDIIASAGRALDSYYWLGHEETGDLKSELAEIRKTADLIVDEFEKVLALRRQAQESLAEAETKLETLTRELRSETFTKVEPFLTGLTSLRTQRGHLITMREIKYIDLARVEALEAQVVEHFDRVSRDCVQFLLRAEAFTNLKKELSKAAAKLPGVKKVADVQPIKDQIDGTAEGLDLLGEVIANLQIEDATQRTTILEGISEVFSQVNRVRAEVDGKRRELATHEGKAEFGAQFKLLGQSVASALSMCDAPEKCDEELARIMVQLEELEARFSEFDEFLGDLASKREEIYEAFSARKQTLLDERQRRAQNLIKAADRILEGVGRRASSLKSADDVNGYFASDAMVMKLRQLAEQLGELSNSVKADEILSKLKTAQQDALRALRDRLDLFEGGGANIIKFGNHRFNVNTQPLEMTVVPRDDGMALHLGGTDFYEAIDDDGFAETRMYWDQDIVSESAEVYRAEYLAASILFDADAGANGLTAQMLYDAARGEGGLLEKVKVIAQDRYDEGYERGIHDADATLILEKLLAMRETAGLLRFPAAERAAATLFWGWYGGDAGKTRWHRQARSLGRLRETHADGSGLAALATELAAEMERFFLEVDLPETDYASAAEYLAEELCADQPRFVVSAEASRIRDDLLADLQVHGQRAAFDDDMRAMSDDLVDLLANARAWVSGFVAAKKPAWTRSAMEAAALLCDRDIDREVSSALTEVEVKGLLGHHGRIDARAMTLQVDEFFGRLGRFARVRVPGYRAYRKLRSELVARERERLRISELMPRVMSSFVRNKLINDSYLPLIGDNLAKQIGAAGDAKRTDLMGMLLLISPPGYGKTTLMEYVANRLGLVFVKINGPSLGHAVHSLDPAEAPNATARQEVEKINLALEMGNNVMLYLDDIQHTHPELLQKFISLCDAQRRIEGVWNGRTRTYDMRGKKFCVVMAGNPYTESGDTFQIPDMLANRADIYNLGDILHGKEELFALSYIENSLTSNQTLAPLATREQADVYKLVRMARGEQIPSAELSHSYSALELTDVQAVLRHMFRCQEVLLAVNQQYITSAAQDDKFREEPPFKLQGSYRNMNKLAEKVMPAMTTEEVEALIDDHYLGEAQTLTTEAEQNLLKLSEMRGRLEGAELERWSEIKEEFVRQRRIGTDGDDPVARLTGALSGLGAQLSSIRHAIEVAVESQNED